MALFGKEEKESRYRESGVEITRGIYNLVIGLITCFGLLANALICFLLPESTIITLYENYGLVLIGYFVLCLTGILVKRFSKNPVVSFIGYCMIVLPVGVVLSMFVYTYSPTAVAGAMLGTAIITGIMTVAGVTRPDAFSRLGWPLLIALLAVIIVEPLLLLLHVASGFIDVLVVFIFSLYIAYDWSRANAYYPTFDNAVDSACDLYLDIINIFIRLLSIIGRRDR